MDEIKKKRDNKRKNKIEREKIRINLHKQICKHMHMKIIYVLAISTRHK